MKILSSVYENTEKYFFPKFGNKNHVLKRARKKITHHKNFHKFSNNLPPRKPLKKFFLDFAVGLVSTGIATSMSLSDRTYASR